MPADPTPTASQRQLRYLRAVAHEAGLDESALALLAFERYEREIAALTRRDASELIDHIQTSREKGGQP